MPIHVSLPPQTTFSCIPKYPGLCRGEAMPSFMTTIADKSLDLQSWSDIKKKKGAFMGIYEGKTQFNLMWMLPKCRICTIPGFQVQLELLLLSGREEEMTPSPHWITHTLRPLSFPHFSLFSTLLPDKSHLWLVSGYQRATSEAVQLFFPSSHHVHHLEA